MSNIKSVKFTQENFITRVKMCIDIHFKEEGLSTENIIPITISNMTRTMGYFRWIGDKPLKLNFSHLLLNGAYDLNGVDEIIEHEIAHYMLFMNGYHREGHGHRFKAMCKKHGFRLDGTIIKGVKKTAVYDDILAKESKYIIKCDTCGKLFYKNRISGIVKHPNTYRHDNCPIGMTKIK